MTKTELDTLGKVIEELQDNILTDSNVEHMVNRLKPIYHKYHAELEGKKQSFGVPEAPKEEYDHINPAHYKQYDVESITMMERIYGVEAVIMFCELNAFKYRMRLASKPNVPIEQDLKKEKWYLDKKKELRHIHKIEKGLTF